MPPYSTLPYVSPVHQCPDAPGKTRLLRAYRTLHGFGIKRCITKGLRIHLLL